MRKGICGSPALSISRTRIIAAIAAAAIGLSAADARAAVVAHWSFDIQASTTGVYQDSVGNNHPATPEDKVNVGPYADVAPFGKAVNFNGQTGAYLKIPPLVNIQKSSFTVAAWVNMTTPGPNFIFTDWESFPQAGFVFGTDPLRDPAQASTIVDMASTQFSPNNNPNKNRLSVVRFPANTRADSKPVPLNEWHHLAWTWERLADGSSGTMTVYIDAESIGNAQKTGRVRPPVDLAINIHPMRIGSRQLGDVNFHGAIDELWIFNEALPPEKLKNLMQHNNTEGAGPLANVAFVRNAAGIASTVKPPTPEPTKNTQVAVATPPVATPAAGTPPVAVNQATVNPTPVTPQPTPVTPAPTASGTGTPATPTIAAAQGGTEASNDGGGGDPGAGAAEPAHISASSGHAATGEGRSISDIGNHVTLPGISKAAPLAAVPHGYSPARLAGVVSCFVASACLWAFVIWGVKERARLRAAGRL